MTKHLLYLLYHTQKGKTWTPLKKVEKSKKNSKRAPMKGDAERKEKSRGACPRLFIAFAN
jgi:hypothetical protein